MADRPPPKSEYAHPAEWYDRIYSAQGKDYPAEADKVAAIIHQIAPDASSLLDVGCGTGLHLLRFADHFVRSSGIDLDHSFVQRAVDRGCDAHVGDMCTFARPTTFDAVTCLYSSIGHVGDVVRLNKAVANMASHLTPGGVFVLEPWYANEQWEDGGFGVEVSDAPDSILTRTNHTASDGRVSILTCAWTHVDLGGITQQYEVLRLTRFTSAEYRTAIEGAGMTAAFLTEGCNGDGKGLWIGRMPG